MLRNRLLILLGGCFLLASAAWADDIGYVDCRNHPEETQVFPKARQTHETVASLPCGERFTVLLNGFIFSRIQTADGKIGYIYSSAITADHSGAAVLRPAAKQAPAATPSAAVTTAADAPPKANTAEPSPAQDAIPTTVAPEKAASVAQANTTSVAPAPAARVQPTSTPAGFPPPAVVQEATTLAAQSNAASVTRPEPAPTQPTPETAAAGVERHNATSPEQPQPTSSTGQPQPSTNSEASQPEPAPVQPAIPAIRAASERDRWEKPNPGTHHAPLVELFGGYGFARLNNGAGTMTNMSGALGSFGWNAKPWLQIVADTSYNVVTVSGVKNVLYGNHYGPRLFYNGRYRWGFTPFVEGLVGGSRADTSTSGTYAASTSVNCLSFKVGGGFDMKPMRHLTIRVLDFDYYRTAFGTNLHQNNYWASTGIVLRLFGAGAE